MPPGHLVLPSGPESLHPARDTPSRHSNALVYRDHTCDKTSSHSQLSGLYQVVSCSAMRLAYTFQNQVHQQARKAGFKPQNVPKSGGYVQRACSSRQERGWRCKLHPAWGSCSQLGRAALASPQRIAPRDQRAICACRCEGASCGIDLLLLKLGNDENNMQ